MKQQLLGNHVNLLAYREKLVDLYDKNTTLRNRIDELKSCEEAKVLKEYLNKIEKPPENGNLWIKENR